MKLFESTNDYFTISEFIEALEAIKEQYGEIPLIAEYPDYGYHYITLVEIVDNQKLDDDKTIVPKAGLLS